MTSNIDMLIRRCFWNKIHIKFLLFTIFIVSLTFIEAYTCYLITKNEIALEKGYEQYGEFQFQFAGLSYDKAIKISQEEHMEKSCIYSAEYISNESAYSYYIDEDFFEFSNVSLLDGKFPDNENEILCEKKFLYKKGLEFSSNSVTKVDYNGKEYIVSGVVSISDIGVTQNVYVPVIFFSYCNFQDKIQNNILACMTDTVNYSVVSDDLRARYNISEDNFTYNNNVLSYAEVDEYNHSTDVFNVTRYLALIIGCVLFILIASNIIIIITKKIKNETMILHSLGIELRNLNLEFQKIILIILLIADFTATIFSCLVLNIYFNKIGTCFRFGKIMLYSFAIIIIYNLIILFIAFLSIKKITSGTIQKAISNIEDVSNKVKNNRSYLHGRKMPFLKVAKLGVSMNRSRHILSILVITISIVTITVFNYISKYIFACEINDSYDYRIDYEYSDISESMFGSSEIKSVYQSMLDNEDLFDLYPIYYSEVSVELDKSAVSEKYKKYSADLSSENYIKFYVNKTGTYRDRFVFIGADEEILKKVFNCDYGQLSDNECIIVKNVTSPNNTSFPIGIEEGTKLQINPTFEDEQSEGSKVLTVIDSIDNINIFIPDTYYQCYVFVNMNNFKTFELYDYPQLIYFNDRNNDSNSVYEFFKGIADINVVNIADENEEINNNRLAMTLIIYLLLILLIILLAVNTIISLFDRFDTNRRKLAMLKAIGIRNSKLYLIQLYDYGRTIFTAVLLGTIFSCIACYCVYISIRSSLYYFIFNLELENLIIPIGVIVAIFAGSLIPSYIRIKRINIIEDLQRNK